ncbi:MULTISPECIES: TetR/AcrR family transcriptional regulator [unclassified Erwinia]|uniref:TetR/AcrR family transcriptional regulator n=1 Tax=unclassified Erwinia TaxID=2622719 RepID=UPI000C18F151|nr:MULTISPECIES: TetR/AcrR family transcriptional regulator [unclassified Erwinia]PIJ50082.1 TetR family transcriptional regulator [Erwinia sp. OAMSP11]PIJ71952.1 TetR family transcriptional regulator [Erwinia sp. OLSSP12]PIJ80934.1 TetR family transcriptional regulator [Erwinia sp. OLCASP19]PIJ83839.1 TetR family transcriptional regulator [Erwinia sp. OLMTSP26]PIJ85997.1 TetR family transcriptional regulator [Erwinia sp. OLMDSP33]
MRKEPTEHRLKRIRQAAIQLATQRSINTISIYDVAREAAIAASTVYHHYPNIEALFCELMNDVFSEFSRVLHHAVDDSKVNHWTDINRMIEQSFVEHYRNTPLVQHILLGHHTYTSVSHADADADADAENDILLGQQVESIYRSYFQLPELPQDVNIFCIALQLADKVYAMNFREGGTITAEMEREAIIITEAYLGTYLPKNMTRAI